jgi:hypothetical protein
MGFVKNYQQLVGVRICLGVAEAGLFPGGFNCFEYDFSPIRLP